MGNTVKTTTHLARPNGKSNQEFWDENFQRFSGSTGAVRELWERFERYFEEHGDNEKPPERSFDEICRPYGGRCPECHRKGRLTEFKF